MNSEGTYTVQYWKYTRDGDEKTKERQEVNVSFNGLAPQANKSYGAIPNTEKKSDFSTTVMGNGVPDVESHPGFFYNLLNQKQFLYTYHDGSVLKAYTDAIKQQFVIEKIAAGANK